MSNASPDSDKRYFKADPRIICNPMKAPKKPDPLKGRYSASTSDSDEQPDADDNFADDDESCGFVDEVKEEQVDKDPELVD